MSILLLLILLVIVMVRIYAAERFHIGSYDPNLYPSEITRGV